MGRREAFPENAGAAASAVAPRLPLSALLAMAMSGFVAILSETLPAGLLPQIGAGLAVSEALAGQLVSVYALGSLLAALPAASLTQGWRRRRVLLLALLIFFVCNSLTAVSSDYRLTLLARFGSGVAAGLAWGLLAGYARRLVPPEQQGRALAVAMLGAPLALSLGVPLGTWLGGLLGWRWAFGLLSLTALLLVGWVLRSVPDFPGQPAGRRLRLLGVLRTPGVRPVLLVIVAWCWRTTSSTPISRRSSPRSAWAPRWTWPCWYSAAPRWRESGWSACWSTGICGGWSWPAWRCSP